MPNPPNTESLVAELREIALGRIGKADSLDFVEEMCRIAADTIASLAEQNIALDAEVARLSAENERQEKWMRDITKMIVSHLGGGSEWFMRVGSEYYADYRVIGPELQRRATDARITKAALVRQNRENERQAKRIAALEGALRPFAAGPCSCGVIHGAVRCLSCSARALLREDGDG